MSAAGIYIDIDGQPVDLGKVSWYEKAPCGCVSGVTMAYSDYGNGPARIVTSAEQAFAEMYETAHERAKYGALGFTMFADLRERCVELMKPRCPHEPRYGVPPRPVVEGLTWAAVDCLGARPKLMHLVPVAAVEAARARNYTSLDAKPLCGGKGAFWWSDEWHSLDGKVECKRCVAAGVKAGESE